MSYHIAKHQSAAKTRLILRHRGEAEKLHNSYRGIGVTEAQGRLYFEILPKPSDKVIKPDFVPTGIVRILRERKMALATP